MGKWLIANLKGKMDREGSEKRSQRLASLLVPCAVEPSCGQQKRPLVKAVSKGR